MWPTAKVPDVAKYLSSLETVIEASKEWKIVQIPDIPESIVAQYVGSSFELGEHLRVQAIQFHDARQEIDFPICPKSWKGDRKLGLPIPDEWINSAFALFEPLARAAAKSLGFTLHVKLSRQRVFKTPRQLEQLINQFAGFANLEILHACDWERFYRIIHHADRYRSTMTPSDLHAELAKRKVPLEMVRELCERYEFGRSLLANRFDWQNAT